MATVELKKYLVLRRQAMFRDMQSGVNLNLFSLKNAYCETPAKVVENPARYPNLITALRLGYLVSTENPPTEGPVRHKQAESPMVGILALDIENFKQRVAMMKSIDLMDQLISIEEHNEGGPRRPYQSVLEAHKIELLAKLDPDNQAAYEASGDPGTKAAVARLPVAKAEIAKDGPEPAKKKKPTVKRNTKK